MLMNPRQQGSCIALFELLNKCGGNILPLCASRYKK